MCLQVFPFDLGREGFGVCDFTLSCPKTCCSEICWIKYCGNCSSDGSPPRLGYLETGGAFLMISCFKYFGISQIYLRFNEILMLRRKDYIYSLTSAGTNGLDNIASGIVKNNF